MTFFEEIPQADLLLCILQCLTIAVTLSLGISNVVLSRRMQKGRNIVDITTGYRLERMKAQQDAMRRLLVHASPVGMRLDAASAARTAGGAIEAAAAFETLLHAHFDRDRELIEAARRTALLAAEFAQSLAADGATPEQERQLAGQLHRTSRLNDMYVAAEWSRIKRETEGRNTKTEEWYVAYDDVRRRCADMERRLQVQEPLCEK